jgi:S-DNA-T family DNA segregation ATPase FtsK/SpoIIIE
VAKKSPPPPLKEALTGERTHYIIGLVLCIFAFYLSLAFASFLFSEGADQSVVESLPLSDAIADHHPLRNWGGASGAYLSDLFINRGFGIPSFIILAFLFILGGRLMKLNKQPLLKRFLFCTSTLIWCSVFFAFAFARSSENAFLYPGGKHGYTVNIWLQDTLGSFGLALLLLATFLVIAILSSTRTLPFLRAIISYPPPS